jgi:hypothetical protein
MSYEADVPSATPPVLPVGRFNGVDTGQFAAELIGTWIDLHHVSLTGYSLALTGLRSRRFGWYSRILGVRSVVVRDDRGIGGMMIEAVEIDDRRIVLVGNQASVTINGHSTIRLELDAERVPRRYRLVNWQTNPVRSQQPQSRPELPTMAALSLTNLLDAGRGTGVEPAPITKDFDTPIDLMAILESLDSWRSIDAEVDISTNSRRSSSELTLVA